MSSRSSLSLLAARTLTVGFYDTVLSDPLKRLLDRGVGGVVLFGRNVVDAEQVAGLVHAIKTYAGRPLMVGLDQEGGLVQRLRVGFTRIPPMRAVGALRDETVAFEMGRLLGRELRAVGVDVNYAPILDVDTNPANPIIGNRSFSRDPALVASLGVALGRGLEAEGVAACGKHFPGHGDTAQDSHHELPRLPHDMKRLEAVELVPFRAWKAAGLSSVMTAHVIFEALDREVPATMSKAVLTGLLRETLGYEGLIITDDIEMKATFDHYGYEKAAKMGLAAGVDNFLCCHTAEVAHGIVDCLVRAVESGEIPEARLVDASNRVGSFVARFARGPERFASERLATKEHLAFVAELLERVDPAAASLGEDPTEAMELIRVARERQAREAAERA